MYHFGLIGCGNMGCAMARAAAGVLASDELLVANRTARKAEILADELGCHVGSNADVAKSCDYIFLAVEPQMMADVLFPLQGFLRERDSVVLVSMAVGISIAEVQQMAGEKYPVIRIMPNLPVSVRKGITLVCASAEVSSGEREEFERMMQSSGMTENISEELFDAAGTLTGCGPAFVCLFLEALADGAVACGVPREKAMQCACQVLIGTASMILESGGHPGELKDAVCSPAGMTIAGIRALEKGGLRGAAMEAVIAAYDKISGGAG